MSASPPSSRPVWAGSGSSSSLLTPMGVDAVGDSTSITVSEEVGRGIDALGRLSASDLSAVVEASWAALLTPSSESIVSPAISDRISRITDQETAKTGVNALCTVLLESGRLNAPEDAVRTVLAKFGLAPDAASGVARSYGTRISALRELHSGPGLLVPQLVDVDWRLDYVVKSSKEGSVNQPMYIVKVTTTCTGSSVLKHVQFTCSPPQLQDLLAKLSDAMRSVATVSKELA